MASQVVLISVDDSPKGEGQNSGARFWLLRAGLCVLGAGSAWEAPCPHFLHTRVHVCTRVHPCMHPHPVHVCT